LVVWSQYLIFKDVLPKTSQSKCKGKEIVCGDDGGQPPKRICAERDSNFMVGRILEMAQKFPHPSHLVSNQVPQTLLVPILASEEPIRTPIEVIEVSEGGGVASKDTTPLQHREEGADDFSEEYEWIRAKVALGRQYTGPVEGTAEGLTLRGPYGFIMRASESDPHRRPHTCFKWKKFWGCPLEALGNVILEGFSEAFGQVDAKIYAKALV
jgi:hypothetical protein